MQNSNTGTNKDMLNLSSCYAQKVAEYNEAVVQNKKGKTMFARKLALNSGMDYAMMTGGVLSKHSETILY